MNQEIQKSPTAFLMDGDSFIDFWMHDRKFNPEYFQDRVMNERYLVPKFSLNRAMHQRYGVEYADDNLDMFLKSISVFNDRWELVNIRPRYLPELTKKPEKKLGKERHLEMSDDEHAYEFVQYAIKLRKQNPVLRIETASWRIRERLKDEARVCYARRA